MTSVKDPDGNTITFGYDQNGNQTQVAYLNGVSENSQYDASDQLTRVYGESNVDLTSYSYSYLNPSTDKQTTSRYSMTDVNGNVTQYSYDALMRLTQATQKTSGGSQIASYGYASTRPGTGPAKTSTAVAPPSSTTPPMS